MYRYFSDGLGMTIRTKHQIDCYLFGFIILYRKHKTKNNHAFRDAYGELAVFRSLYKEDENLLNIIV